MDMSKEEFEKNTKKIIIAPYEKLHYFISQFSMLQFRGEEDLIEKILQYLNNDMTKPHSFSFKDLVEVLNEIQKVSTLLDQVTLEVLRERQKKIDKEN